MIRTHVLLQLTDVQSSVRDHFSRGGTVAGVVGVLLALGGIVALCVALTRRQSRRTGLTPHTDPKALFLALIDQLRLPVPERRVLLALAGVSPLSHPSTLLLSRTAFRERAREWQERIRRPDAAAEARRRLATLERRLFGPCADPEFQSSEA
jgi:hypothetical protein